MGTNYYVKGTKCDHCGRSDEDKHIGKSSAGWVFALRIYPEDGIKDLADWIDFWRSRTIMDEYDRPITSEEMLAVILLRWRKDGNGLRSQNGCAHGFTYETFDRKFS